MIVDERECYKMMCVELSGPEVHRECVGRQCMVWCWVHGTHEVGTESGVVFPTKAQELRLGYCGYTYSQVVDRGDIERAVKHIPEEER